jgi:hypothetical protein
MEGPDPIPIRVGEASPGASLPEALDFPAPSVLQFGFGLEDFPTCAQGFSGPRPCFRRAASA